jgi:signal transduction histidine kinase
MINAIMQTTQLEAGVIAVELAAVNVTALLDGLKADYAIYRMKPDVSLAWDYPREPLLIVSDQAKLKQILENLINNALKFTAAGMVTITARLETPAAESAAKRRFRLSVSDTGLGIEREKLVLIFAKFYQVDSSETRIYSGVGLGLYIVKQYINLLGGEIAVESEPGNGSTFTVTIPLDP